MNQSKRLLSFIFAFSFTIGCFLPVQAYASERQPTAENQTSKNIEVMQILISQNDKASDNKDSNDKTSKGDPEVSDTQKDQAAGDDGDNTIAAPEEGDTNVQDKDDKDSKDDKDNKDNKEEKDIKNDEDLWYREQNPMKKEHQKLLWEYCKKRDLNYIDMLALIDTESNFNEKCTTGKYHGYFQISSGNCANLSAELKTKNKPLDGAININWGTAMYSWILADKRVKDLKGDKKRDVALSIYQRGTGGYDKYGISTKFLKTYNKKRDKICEWFEVKK